MSCDCAVGFRWDNNRHLWECPNCSLPAGGTSSYISNNSSSDIGIVDIWFQDTKSKCECGGEAAKTTHAFYCPVYIK